MFGVAFPVLAAAIRVVQLGWEGALAAFAADPLMWIIASAPLFLGALAALGGAREDRVLALAADLERRVAENTDQAVRSLRQGAVELSGSVVRMDPAVARIHQALAEAAQQTLAASASASAARDAVGSAAGGVGAMDGAMQEVARSAAGASKVVRDAVALSRQTDELVARLARSSDAIHAVVDLVADIAEQTDILALNAAIEAARSGERGGGFAVVAGEIKRLSGQVARATDDIGSQVDSIRRDATCALGSVGRIREVVGQIDELQATIAAAVEEQAATAREVSYSLSAASDASREVAARLGEVAERTARSTDGVGEFRSSAAVIQEVAASLGARAARFQRGA